MLTSSNIFHWLWPYGGDAAKFDIQVESRGFVSGYLNSQRLTSNQDVPQFLPSTDTLGALEYERCVGNGFIPTRDLSHDWYNGQVWLAFPKTKQQINARHIEDAARASQLPMPAAANGRSRLRDALTLFDESGALLLTTEPALSAALLDHDWNTLFVEQRENWSARTRVLIAGHGLLDAMHNPYKGLCAKAVPVHVQSLDLSREELDVLLCSVLDQLQDPGNLSPLPVMGIPGWFIASEALGFYTDASVYRAKPTRRISSFHERLAFVWDGSTLRSRKCVGQSLPEFQGEESPDSSEHGAG